MRAHSALSRMGAAGIDCSDTVGIPWDHHATSLLFNQAGPQGLLTSGADWSDVAGVNSKVGEVGMWQRWGMWKADTHADRKGKPG